LGYSLTDKIPSHSTISQNRITRFKGTDVYQKIFDEIVRKAMSLKLVDGKVLYTDSTHLKANANKRKLISQEIETSVKSYTEALDKAIDEERKNHGKKELKKNF
jgi:transposase